MADDGESLESWLSKFTLKTLISRNLFKLEVCTYVLHNRSSLKRLLDSHDIPESERYRANSSELSESVADGSCR